MCAQYRGGGRGGSVLGDILSTVGNMMNVGGISWVPCGDIMIHLEEGDIMSVVGGGGGNLVLFEYFHGTEHPHVLMVSPTVLK